MHSDHKTTPPPNASFDPNKPSEETMNVLFQIHEAHVRGRLAHQQFQADAKKSQTHPQEEAKSAAPFDAGDAKAVDARPLQKKHKTIFYDLTSFKHTNLDEKQFFPL